MEARPLTSPFFPLFPFSFSVLDGEPESNFDATLNRLDDGSFLLISACKDGNPMLRNWLGDWVGTFLGKPRLPCFLTLRDTWLMCAGFLL